MKTADDDPNEPWDSLVLHAAPSTVAKVMQEALAKAKAMNVPGADTATVTAHPAVKIMVAGVPKEHLEALARDHLEPAIRQFRDLQEEA